MLRNPDRQIFHQLLLQQPRVIDLFLGRSLKTLGLCRRKIQSRQDFGIEVHFFSYLALNTAR
jgi:hypothetical protein